MPAVVAPNAALIRVEKRGGLPAIAGVPGAVVNDEIRFRVSNEDVDLFGDVVVQAGLQFPASIPAVADHSHRLDAAIGDWRNVERAGRETFATLRLLPRGASRMADLVRALHEGGYPLASSVYFDIAPADIEPVTRAGPDGRAVPTRGKRYRKGLVREITLTQFPANSSAVAVARSLGFNDAELAALSRTEPAAVSIARANTAVAGAHARTTSMKLAEMIAAAQAAHETAPATLGTATTALEADSSETNLTAVQRATTEADALFSRLTVLRGAETAATRRAAASAAPNPAAATSVARAVAAVADNRSAAINTRRTETRAMLQEDLVPMSIWANLASQGTSLNFNGANSVVVPQMNVGITADGAWVGEGGAIPLVKGNLTAKRLSRYKLGGIVPITKELQRTSDPQAVEVMRRLLMRVISNLLDSSLISALAENPGVRPAGIMFGVVTTPGAAGGGIAAVIADLKTLVGKFITANVGSKPVLLMNSMTKLSLGLMTNALGQFFLSTEAASSLPPIIASPIVPAGTVILVDADAFASAFDDMEIDISESATVQMANSDAVAPTHAGAGPLGGALGVAHEVPVDGGIPISGGNGASIAGSVAISFWQTWSLGIRLVMPASFGITKAGAVQGVTGVTW